MCPASPARRCAPLRVSATAGLTAGTSPITGQSGPAQARRACSAAAEAVLQATTSPFAPCARSQAAHASDSAAISSRGRGP